MARFIGVDEQVELPATTISGDEVFHLVNEDLTLDIIPGHRATGKGTAISINNQVSVAANYELKLRNDLVSVVSMNFNRSE